MGVVVVYLGLGLQPQSCQLSLDSEVPLVFRTGCLNLESLDCVCKLWETAWLLDLSTQNVDRSFINSNDLELFA